MTVWLILLIIAAVLILLAKLRLGVRVSYGPQGLGVKLRVGAIPIQVLPAKKKKPAKQKKKKKKKKKPRPKPDIKALLPLIRALLPVGKEAMLAMGERLYIREIKIHLIWGEEDPADAAIHYGYAWGGVEAGLSFLEANRPLGRRDVSLELDCRRTKPVFDLALELSVKLGQILAVGIPAGIQALKILLQYRKEHKPSGETQSAGART